MNGKLRIAIVHYHLKRGGVTRVIESTLKGLGELETCHQCVVLTGEIPEGTGFSESVRIVQGLKYSNAQELTPEPAELIDRMRLEAESALGGPPDIWHIHNHSLGKNHAIPGVVSLLAQAGEKLLLQMHDFAEDGRPENHLLNQLDKRFAGKLYPDCKQVHYAVLNARDYSIISSTNIDRDRIHLLANPVGGSPGKIDPEQTREIRHKLSAEKLILYPVRAVRRKNFGELLYWAALAEPGTVFATTLGPTNINFVDQFQRWKSFAENLSLPITFSIGESNKWGFAEMMAAADAIITTSIAEGFGLAFLEPWLFGKSICGRGLQDITSDFKEHGIQLGHLYKAIPIPIDWIDKLSLKNKISSSIEQIYNSYKSPVPANATDLALKSITPMPGYIDFAGLDEEMQAGVLERLVKDPDCRSDLPLQKLEIPSPCGQAELIERNYSLARYAKKLDEIYMALANAPVTGVNYLEEKILLEQFLIPDRFRLLRT